MAVAIENSFGLKPKLVDGEDGIFDVAVDGNVVFSKQETGGFIEAPEVVELVRTSMDELSA